MIKLEKISPEILTQWAPSSLVVGVKPFKLRVDWAVHDAYPEDNEPIVVELHIMDERVRTLCKTTSIPRAVDYALRWLTQRGFEYRCDVDTHQRMNHKHITLHPVPSRLTDYSLEEYPD